MANPEPRGFSTHFRFTPIAGSIPAFSITRLRANTGSRRALACVDFGNTGTGVPSEGGARYPSGTIHPTDMTSRHGGFLRSEQKIMTNDMTELDDEFYEEFYEEDEDEFEDYSTMAQAIAKFPEDWTLVRVMCGYEKMADMDEWLTENTTAEFARVGWGGECSYSVGVMLENEMDAILFKLRYG